MYLFLTEIPIINFWTLDILKLGYNRIMYIKVRVTDGAKKEKVEKKSEDHYIISVKEKAERNMANNRICEIIATLESISIKSVRIINGHHSSSKILSVNLS